MRCPYLQVAAVKSCIHAGPRLLVPGGGRCASPEYARCAEWPASEPGGAERCPYLEEDLMQYCSAATVRKFVPYNESSLSRCTCEGYRYCEAFLDAAMPAGRGRAAFPPAAAACSGEEEVDGVRIPMWLLYAPNHMWLDPGDDGLCHLGIDGLFARTLESVEQISFLTLTGTARPAAVLTARGVDVLVVFPGRVRIATPNLYLRTNPSRLVRDPYSLGWLFQVREQPGALAREGLVTGAAAAAWMRRDAESLRRYPPPQGREDLIRMFHEFFSPMAIRENQP